MSEESRPSPPPPRRLSKVPAAPPPGPAAVAAAVAVAESAMAVESLRILLPVPGQSFVGVEVPNRVLPAAGARRQESPWIWPAASRSIWR
jgi:hypothetical protein